MSKNTYKSVDSLSIATIAVSIFGIISQIVLLVLAIVSGN